MNYYVGYQLGSLVEAMEGVGMRVLYASLTALVRSQNPSFVPG
jgi:hypothetical protein